MTLTAQYGAPRALRIGGEPPHLKRVPRQSVREVEQRLVTGERRAPRDVGIGEGKPILVRLGKRIGGAGALEIILNRGAVSPDLGGRVHQ